MKKTILLIVMATLCTFFCAKVQTIYHISGIIKDENGLPLPGATIKIKETSIMASSDKNGKFTISAPSTKVTLQISFLGYQPKDITLTKASVSLEIQLKPDQNSLNEIQVIGYGTTTKRLNTGSVSTITAKQIEEQPVTNVLSALSGRMPGVFVQTTNGLPGGNINIQIRGTGSIAAGTNPLYIVDGVPFESSIIDPNSLIGTGNMSGAINPLNSINPADIESISVLKDADATAIYGSRGTNGVVLITTKKGSGEITKTNISLSRGINQSTNLAKLLNLQDYLQIRREAFTNTNQTPTITNAPDLLLWDQNQDINWPDYLFGNNAENTDLQASLTGGSGRTTFNTSVNYHQESNVLSDLAKYTRGGLHFNLNHRSSDQKFQLQLTNSIILDNNRSPNLQGASSGLLLPPNFPLINTSGNYQWRGTNPLAEMNATTTAKTDNIITNINLSYELFNSLNFKLSTGYSKINTNQVQLFPMRSLSPGSTNYTQYGQNSNQAYLVEPQINYQKKINNSQLSMLLGGTYQEKSGRDLFLRSSDYSNEELMEDIASAATVDIRSNNNTNYKYLSIFGRATYNLNSKYILSLTFRRDGSSKFGDGNRFGNFGAIGAAWLFGEEQFLKDHLGFLSFGKLRSSYGTTGNDQITDYQYLSTYSSQGYTYEGISTLNPSRIDNANFHWETTRKLEFALETGFLKNRILFNLNYYRNRSKDQLVQYNLPVITGFASYQANLPAIVQNTGWELELTTVNLQNHNIKWSSTFNLTIPKNKLVSFQNIEDSGYAQTLVVGYDITRIYGYQFLGINHQTGNASYGDQNGLSSQSPYYFNTIGKRTPDFYGGLGNTVTYHNFSIDLFFQFAKQMLSGGLRSSPGLLINNYAFIKERWQQPGDITNVPKASTIFDSYYASSSANYFDSSYLRLKNVAINYRLPTELTSKMKLQTLNLFLRGQNLITFWNNNNPLMDPESGALSATQRNIPPIKSLVIGFNLTF
ncbi:SusC/RagA family TonB-linked outer membrane protein [Pedobacter sp. N36a]|uniref:SusC/RagA family TonB-linked outer membrane protein n=1 Tax=Pedobacter sp. N36a TaxID=2767996 RepID=UPI001656E7B7|nr:SusC/RagA family TonB-linked outer membrane protein [Pedobacter sp. N36a]MBC8986677.1 SusC/RagA family TonB-linked outer membrane protein [Pedobacter sp. N36a]